MGSTAYARKKKAMWLYPKVMGFNPSERWGHSACYYQGSVYFYGGCCGGLHFSDVAVLNLETMVWKMMESIGEKPGPRDSHSAVLVKNKMIIFGGTNGLNKLNLLHVLDLDTREWTRPECTGTSPSPRESHSATLVGDDKLVIFGGSGEGEGNYLNDLHVLHLQTMRWSKFETRGDMPTPRDSHSAVVVGRRFFVYGGDCGDQYLGDIEILDLDFLTWSKFRAQGSSPGNRAGHTAINIGTKIYVIGGVGDRRYYSDAWLLDVSTTCSWTQLNICGQRPQGRFSHTAIAADSDIVVYGGCGEDERPLNELLILQLGNENSNRQRTDQSFRLLSETDLHGKRKRTSAAPIWEAESEQEEQSLSLSHHSSPSQSDHDQTLLRKSADSASTSQEFPFLNPCNLDRGLHNLIGAEVTGRVDGAFDSGVLIGASVNGKSFRGVLFPPVQGLFPSGIGVTRPAHPISTAYKLEHFGHMPKQPVAYLMPESIHSLSYPHDQLSESRSVVKAAPSTCLIRDSSKLRNDLEGVVLTLGGPGNCPGGSK